MAAPTNQVKPGDIVLFYRTGDEKALTTLGIVERYEVHDDATNIMQIVSRRTVYSQKDIETMAKTPTKVMLFRLASHFLSSIPYKVLTQEGIVSGPIQSITKISDDSFSRILRHSQR